MARVEEVRVPDIGDFADVDVVEVHVASGDEIREEQELITLESEKAAMDVPSPLAGTVVEVKVKRGDQVSEGDLILLVEVEEEAAEETGGPPAEEEVEAPAEDTAAESVPEGESTEKEQEPSEPPPREGPRSDGEEAAVAEGEIDEAAFRRAHASPAVRRLARELGVDLGRVGGSGRKGRIVAEDVQAFVKRALARQERPAAAGLALPEVPEIDFARFGQIERVPLSRIRRISGPNVHRSWLNVPHVTHFDEADITELEAFRKALAREAEERGFKLTVLALIAKACAHVLRELPEVGSSLDRDGEHLIVKKYRHLGFAVNTDEGLVVPVIRDVDRKGIFQVAKELGELSERARKGKMGLAEMQGASFTISSLGGIGGTGFTPIVNAPEVAILGVSRARLQPVYRDGDLVPRLILPFCLSYDHRVIDGALAARFCAYLAGLLSDIRRMLL